jgi:hypothetical protein
MQTPRDPIQTGKLSIDEGTFPLEDVTFPFDDVTFPLQGVTTTTYRDFFVNDRGDSPAPAPRRRPGLECDLQPACWRAGPSVR